MLYPDMEPIPGVELPPDCMLVAQIKITQFLDEDGKQLINVESTRPMDTITMVGMLGVATHHALVRNDEKQ